MKDERESILARSQWNKLETAEVPATIAEHRVVAALHLGAGLFAGYVAHVAANAETHPFLAAACVVGGVSQLVLSGYRLRRADELRQAQH